MKKFFYTLLILSSFSQAICMDKNTPKAGNEEELQWLKKQDILVLMNDLGSQLKEDPLVPSKTMSTDGMYNENTDLSSISFDLAEDVTWVGSISQDEWPLVMDATERIRRKQRDVHST